MTRRRDNEETETRRAVDLEARRRRDRRRARRRCGAFGDRDLISGRHADAASRVRRDQERALVDLVGRLGSTRRELLDEREEPGAANHGDRARRPHLVARIRSLQLLDR